MERFEKFSSKVTALVLGVIALGALGLVGYPIIGALRSTGEVDYCYIDHQNMGTVTAGVQGNSASTTNTSVTVFTLNGHREWRGDRVIGTNYPSIEAVKADADRIGCSVR